MPEEREFTDFDAALGFVNERCSYCGAFKHVDSSGLTGASICLNACALPYGLVAKMNAELAVIWDRIQAENRERGIH